MSNIFGIGKNESFAKEQLDTVQYENANQLHGIFGVSFTFFLFRIMKTVFEFHIC